MGEFDTSLLNNDIKWVKMAQRVVMIWYIKSWQIMMK